MIAKTFFRMSRERFDRSERRCWQDPPTAVDLGVSLAQQGKKVLLIDAEALTSYAREFCKLTDRSDRMYLGA